MITKVQGEAPFQVLTNNFSISPSSQGYTLQISADGKAFSNLFTVAPNTTRMVSNVAANSYYRLLGNQSEVLVNWMKTCVTAGGSGGNAGELEPVTEFPVGAAEGTVVSLVSGDTMGLYQYDGTEWHLVSENTDLSQYWTSGETKTYVDGQISAVTDMMQEKEEVIASALTELNETFDNYYTMDEVDAAIEEAISGISFDGYWTSAETKNYVDGQVSGLTEYIEDVERVAATALTELHTDILALSAATPDMSNYYTKSEVDAEITGATEGFATEAYVDDAISGLTDMMETKEEVIASALIDLNTNKVGSTDVSTIEKISQAGYDALVSGGTVDSYTLYIITGQTGN